MAKIKTERVFVPFSFARHHSNDGSFLNCWYFRGTGRVKIVILSLHSKTLLFFGFIHTPNSADFNTKYMTMLVILMENLIFG